MYKIIEIHTTYPDKESAQKMSEYLLHERLCACTNMVETLSNYRWNEIVQTETEYILYIKTSLEKFTLAIDQLKVMHPYQLPAILYVEINCSKEYFAWVNAETMDIQE